MPLDRHFWWIGGLAIIGGVLLALFALVNSSGGWEATRLWFYLLASAMLTITGIQLIIYWIQMRVLEELSYRDELIALELHSEEKETV